MIKAVLIDDESSAIEVLQEIIKCYVPDVTIIATADTADRAINAIRTCKPDLIFLDIRLGNDTGFDVLEQTRDFHYEVIFTTAYGEYREKAFDFFALNYLTKPIDVDKLETSIERYKLRNQNTYTQDKLDELKKMAGRSSGRIALAVKDGYTIIPVEDIVRCEADSNYTSVYIKDNQCIVVAKTLSYFESQLQGYRFFRIHKSHLINTDYVREIKTDGSVLLSDNQKVVVAQRLRKAFMDYLQNMY